MSPTAPPPTYPRRRPPVTERREHGRAGRTRAPRGSLASWDRSRAGDALEILRSETAIRFQELVPIRYGRMAVSPWTYYRGAAGVMAADLATRDHSGVMVQLCGDAHVLNFGLWATPERQLSFDLRDFDETLPGPFEYDVARLVASLVVLTRDQGVDDSVAERAVARCVRAYRDRMRRYTTAGQLDIWYDLVTVDDLIKLFTSIDHATLSARIEKRAKRRTSRGVIDKLTEVVDGHLRITDDPPVRNHLTEDQFGLANEVLSAYRASLPPETRHLLDRFYFVDAIQQVVGVGSVGMRVILVLFEGRDGHDPLFLQIKQAGPSVYEEHLEPSAEGNHGERVIAGRKLIQSASDIFVGWTSVRGNDFYVRQFRDMKVIPKGEVIAPVIVDFATACGGVLARAHARTGDAMAIDAYVGKGRRFDAALTEFAFGYADQTATDHAQLVDAIAAGELKAVDA